MWQEPTEVGSQFSQPLPYLLFRRILAIFYSSACFLDGEELYCIRFAEQPSFLFYNPHNVHSTFFKNELKLLHVWCMQCWCCSASSPRPWLGRNGTPQAFPPRSRSPLCRGGNSPCSSSSAEQGLSSPTRSSLPSSHKLSMGVSMMSGPHASCKLCVRSYRYVFASHLRFRITRVTFKLRQV